MKLKFETPTGFDWFEKLSTEVPVPRIGEHVVVRRMHKGAYSHSWVQLKVVKIIHDYDEREIYIELKEEK